MERKSPRFCIDELCVVFIQYLARSEFLAFEVHMCFRENDGGGGNIPHNIYSIVPFRGRCVWIACGICAIQCLVIGAARAIRLDLD